MHCVTSSAMTITASQLEQLIAAARVACANAYAPYSAFNVGAACLTRNGRVYSGANVENASYGLSICAERSAIFHAVGAGERDVAAVAIFTPTPRPVTPCGACRQVICEFGEDVEVVACSEDGTLARWTAAELLPHRFRL